MTVRFRVLGGTAVVCDGVANPVAGSAARSLFASLLLNVGRYVTFEALSAAMWDSPPRTAKESVRNAVARLRAQFETLEVGLGARLTTRPGRSGAAGAYCLAAERQEVDHLVFRDLAAQGRAAIRAHEAARAAALLCSALAVWAGRAGEDVPSTQAIVPRLHSLDAEWSHCVEDYFEARLALGESGDIVGELQSFLADNPLRERACGQLMRAFVACGDIHAALAAFMELRQRLDDELGVAPSAELTHIHIAVLRRESIG